MRYSSFNSIRVATRKVIPLFATLTIASAGPAVPQSTHAAPISAGAAGSLLVPGSSDLTTAHFRDTTISFRFIQDRLPNGDSVNNDRGVGHEQVRRVTYKGQPAIQFVRTVDLNGRMYVDSSTVLADGLTPQSEVSILGSRRTTYAYDGARVHRSITQPDSAAKVSDHDFGTPMFHFEGLDAVIRSIPLRPDYRTIVRLYSEGDDAIEMDTISVEGRDGAGVWNVRFADPVIIAHYGIDGNTRRIVHYDIARHADRAHFRYVFDQ